MKYMIRIGLQLPKPLLDKLDRLVVKDAMKRAAYIRHVLWLWIQEHERGTVVRRNNDNAGGAAGGAAYGTTA